MIQDLFMTLCTKLIVKNKMATKYDEEVLVDSLIRDLLEPTKSIILWNDDVNSFDHVINCLIEHGKHNVEQAEQSAIIVHNNGKCSIKNGSFDKLKPIVEKLSQEGLSTTIE